jgi:hypothetical protein
VLVVLSSDFGELANAVYLLRGSALAARVLMPPPLFATNRDALPFPAADFSGAREVLDVAARAKPDLVLLFSAYLFPINGLIPAEDAATLLAGLRSLGIPVATSDPFLGLFCGAAPPPVSPQHPRAAALVAEVAGLAAPVREIPHVYPVAPGDGAPERSAWFFNPRILVSQAERDALTRGLAGPLPLDAGRQRWLFVLSGEDYVAQCSLLGSDRFVALLLGRLEDAVRAGRQPVVVGPVACMDALAASGREIPGLVLVPFASHGVFTGLLLEAEHVFYWNVLSNSIAARMVNRLSAFFFDRGHLARALPTLEARARLSYFAGAALAMLPPDRALEPQALTSAAAAQDRALAPAVAAFRSGPTAEAMVARLAG